MAHAPFPTINHRPVRLRKVDDGTGNDVSLPETYTIPESGYTESLGFGNGLPVNIEIKNVGSDSAADDIVQIQTHTDPEFATDPIVPEDYGEISFASIQTDCVVMYYVDRGGAEYFRIANPAGNPDIQVRVWYKPRT